MYRIGEYYEKDGIKGVVVSSSYNGSLVMSLDEAFLNWHEAEKWCKSLGDGWFMPSVADFEQMKDASNLKKIQETLIYKGMPLCFGDKVCEGTHRLGHMYWTKDLQSHVSGSEFMYVFCLCPRGFSSFSSDYKEAEYSYIRAMRRI